MTQPNKTLADLLDGVEVVQLQGDRRLPVAGLTCDSRRLSAGEVFVALEGLDADGHRFVGQAAARGAAAAVVSAPVSSDRPLAVVRVRDTREALAKMAANLFDHPSRRMSLIGITGTNGKTTLTYLLESVLRAASLDPAVIGTVDVRFAGRREASEHTTPQAPELQALLDRMRQAGVSHVLMEVSSHALELQRVRGCHFQLGVFTNLSRDHLDFHGDLERYAAAKALLFSRELTDSRAPGKLAVVNDGDPHSGRMLRGWSGPVLRYALERRADVHPIGEPEAGLDGVQLRVAFPGGELEVRSKLAGGHNLQNLLAAVAVGRALGVEAEAISAGLTACQRVPGRLERVDALARGPAVFVDYAHTDDALLNVLGALRPLVAGRLLVVFGCGGDRDRGKRPLMGAAVARWADLAVVTSDNPRSEDPEAIIAQILPGLDSAGFRRVAPAELEGGERGVTCVQPNRRAAIDLAITTAGEEDVVLIAGKGHETVQIAATGRRDFDDRVEARRALERAAREASS